MKFSVRFTALVLAAASAGRGATSFSGTYTIHDNSTPQNTITFQVSVNVQYSVQADGTGTTSLTSTVAVTANPGGFDSVTVGGDYAAGGVVYENQHGGVLTVTGVSAGQQINISAFATISGVAWNISGGHTAGVIGNVQGKSASRRFQVSSTNPNSFDITVQMYDACSDALLGSVTIPAGGSKAWSATDEEGCGIQTAIVTKGEQWNPATGSWDAGDPDTVYSINDAFLAPSTGTPVAAGGSTALNRSESSSVPLPTQTNLTGTGGLAGVTEGQVPFTNTQLADTASLSNGVYRSGANAVVDSVNRAADKISAAVGSGGGTGGTGGTGGGGTTDLTPVTSAIGTTNNKLDTLNTAVSGGADQASAGFPASSSQAMNADKTASVDVLLAKLPTPPTLPTGIGSSATFDVTLNFGEEPIVGGLGAKTLHLDLAPYSSVISVVRGVELFGLTLSFFFIVVGLFRGAVSG
ncbi:MAG TPA: hypothetical protein VG710_17915 [Opitutus sp.]|nr:hypothetical protein [Opitutus sp.]